MNQLIVYALSQITAVDAITEQRQRFDELRTRMPQAEAEAALAELLASRT